MSHKDFTQDPTYSTHFDTYKQLLLKLLRHDPKMFWLQKESKIVDVGCGYGDLMKLLRTRGYTKLIGIEPDPLCRKACLKDNLDVRSGTISKTGLSNAFADVVIVNQVFHHIDDYADAITELARILKPNGLLCFLEPSPTLLRRAMDFLTFQTPLPKLSSSVKTRYEVMRLEIQTGLYPQFLRSQNSFHKTLSRHFSKVWLKQGWFFQFGKYRKR